MSGGGSTLGERSVEVEGSNLYGALNLSLLFLDLLINHFSWMFSRNKVNKNMVLKTCILKKAHNPWKMCEVPNSTKTLSVEQTCAYFYN